MPPTQDTAPPSKDRPLAQFRNESGAFDLPSILVGVVVVGILTAGVLAAIFGVIPFAQDKGAQQDLDSIRTAEGVAKAQKGGYKTSPELISEGLIPGQGKAAADIDAGGTCYAAVAKSGSGNFFFSTSITPSVKQLSDPSAVGCVSSAQVQAMIDSLGGSVPVPGGPAAGVISKTENAPDGVVTFMNADLAYNASPEILHGIQPGDDFSYPNYDAFYASPVQGTWDAAYAALYRDPEAATAYNKLINRPDANIPGLLAAKLDAENGFWNNPTAETQQIFIDALKALYKAALEAPRMTFPAIHDGASATPVTAAAATEDSALQVRYANAQIAYFGSQENLYMTAARAEASSTGDYSASNGYQQALDVSSAAQEWRALTLYGADGYFITRTVVENLTNRTDSGIPALYADAEAKKAAFESSTDLADAAVKQQAYVDALHLMYTTALATPPVYSDLHAVPVNSTVTVPQGTASTVNLQMRLPAGATVDKTTLQVSDYGVIGSATYTEPRHTGGDLWSVNMDVYAYQAAGSYQVMFKLKDPATGLSFYHQFTVVVQ